jgi:hypothetical protein
MEKLSRLGEKYITNEGLEVEIIEYTNALDCTIRYKDGFILKNKNFFDIKNGKVKNPYNPNVYGVGFLGDGEYRTKENKVRTKSYLVWSDILRRCYDANTQVSRPSYQECTVSAEWHNFQNFAKWFEENYIEGFCIDKDILFKNNKVYSKETCCFVPNEINILLSGTNKLKRTLPLGVVEHKGKFRAQICLNGKTTYLGIASTPEKAFLFYKKKKEEYLKFMAYRWKDKIPLSAFVSLFNYTVEITD